MKNNPSVTSMQKDLTLQLMPGSSSFSSSHTTSLEFSNPYGFYFPQRGKVISVGSEDENGCDLELRLSIREEYYQTSRLSPSSLKYYDICLQKGSYKVRLHFAKILFSDDATSQGNGRRIFDVSIQGNVVRKDFDVAEEAGGKGTTAVPNRGVYGPLISAISVTPKFGTRGLSSLAIAGIIFASLVSLGLILVVLWMKGFLGGKDTEDEDDTQDLIEDEEQFRRVKEWISSYHLGTVEVTYVLSNFFDISVV
ncbi:hypothetical protein AgCh_027064 [Apium graveolens]